MTYIVIHDFTDLQDNDHIYYKGDTYPRKGKVSDERIAELSSTNNKRKTVLIELEEGAPKEFPKHTGGGYYELSNGERMQGKDAAIEAEKALQG